MAQPSPPKLLIPAASPSGTGTTTTPTGRPPMWTKSALRKMARLYVYTTLPLETIVRLVHARLPDSTPGIDSANKKLNSLLDKEPRWLHPRTDTDMGRRVAQLSKSSTRTSFAAAEAAFDHDGPARVRLDEAAASPVTRRPVSPVDSDAVVGPAEKRFSGPQGRHHPNHHHPSAAASPGSQVAAAGSPVEDFAEGGGLSSFLRRTTCLSTSTDGTTSSFRQLLPAYSEPYIRTVKRLLKRFTAPIASRSSMSPLSDGDTRLRTWLDDDDGPRPFGIEPHPLPGDFLWLDIFSQRQVCLALPEAHRHGRCPCFNRLETCTSPWVAADGMTPAARRLLQHGPTRLDVIDMDCFGNTVLHFLAARGSIKLLLQVVQTDMCNPILNARNTAGQTFVHVMNRSEMQNTALLCHTLRVLSTKGFNMSALDIYGRNLGHMLHLAGSCPETVRHVCQHYNVGRCNRRDAFGMTPTGQAEPTGLAPAPSAAQPPPPSMGPGSSSNPALANEARLLEYVRLARERPLLEDADGRNGLDCLAMATLSFGSLSHKYRLEASVLEQSSKKPQNRAERDLDSCSARLAFRHSLAAGLAEAGVDANHYDARGNTPLMAFAAQLPEDKDHKTGPQILELLVRHGADVQARNRGGETALHVAVRCGRKLAVKTLVRHGASVHARDAAGRSVLDVADAQMARARAADPREYAHYEACRAWLSSSRGRAVQKPTVLDEWGGGAR